MSLLSFERCLRDLLVVKAVEGVKLKGYISTQHPLTRYLMLQVTVPTDLRVNWEEVDCEVHSTTVHRALGVTGYVLRRPYYRQDYTKADVGNFLHAKTLADVIKLCGNTTSSVLSFLWSEWNV